MKSYVKVYFSYFEYGEDDFVPCECCTKRANDIHHILNRKRRSDLLNNIINLMALCRECHTKYGDKNQWIEFLQSKHNQFMKNHGKHKL